VGAPCREMCTLACGAHLSETRVAPGGGGDGEVSACLARCAVCARRRRWVTHDDRWRGECASVRWSRAPSGLSARCAAGAGQLTGGRGSPDTPRRRAYTIAQHRRTRVSGLIGMLRSAAEGSLLVVNPPSHGAAEFARLKRASTAGSFRSWNEGRRDGGASHSPSRVSAVRRARRHGVRSRWSPPRVGKFSNLDDCERSAAKPDQGGCDRSTRRVEWTKVGGSC